MPGLYRASLHSIGAARPSPSIRLTSRRTLGTSAKTSKRIRWTPIAVLVGIAAYAIPQPLAADEDSKPPRPASSLQSQSTSSLLRAHLVFSLCSIPPLIDHAPSLLRTLTHSPIPGLKDVTEGVVRHTFFRQFVPGETVEECKDEMIALREAGIGSVLNYSAEAEEEAPLDKATVREAEKKLEAERLDEVFKAIEQAGAYEDQLAAEGYGRGATAFALKVTGLISPDILARASNTLLRLRYVSSSNSASSPLADAFVPYPGAPKEQDAQVVARPAGTSVDPILALKGEVGQIGLTSTDEGLRRGDIEELQELWEKLCTIADRAKAHKVALLLDAEYTLYQPALDAYTLLLSMAYNKPRRSSFARPVEDINPLIYGTYQSYLVRQPQLLMQAIHHAQKHEYTLGIKLVRGAYHVQERKRWKEEARTGRDPVWPDKPSTDQCYNSSISVILSSMAAQLASPRPELALSVVFGTHNPESCQLVMDDLVRLGLADEIQSGPSGTTDGQRHLKLREDVKGKIHIAQLYGMGDALTDHVASTFQQHDKSDIPVALKYIAYGKLSEVMPFLGRRATENKSLMSGERGAAAERARISKELWRRVRGGAA